VGGVLTIQILPPQQHLRFFERRREWRRQDAEGTNAERSRAGTHGGVEWEEAWVVCGWFVSTWHTSVNQWFTDVSSAFSTAATASRVTAVGRHLKQYFPIETPPFELSVRFAALIIRCRKLR